MWWLVLIVFQMSAAQFSYKMDYDECNLCIGPDCVVLRLAVCKYFSKAADLMEEKLVPDESDDEGFKLTVDGMLYDLVENAGNYETCIPYVSMYTECSKENICTGCKICRCEETGTWRCSVIQKCWPDSLGVDRKKLKTVIDSFRSQPIDKRQFRPTRSITSENTADIKTASNKTEGKHTYETEQVSTSNSKGALLDPSTSASEKLDNESAVKETDNLSFEDVLNDIVEDNKISLRKTILKEDLSFLFLEKENITEYSTISAEEFVHMLNALEELETTESPTATEVVIDLLKTPSNYDDIDNDKRNFVKEGIDINSISAAINKENGNVNKREVSTIENPTCNDTVTYKDTAFNMRDLEENVLEPLTDIINTKKQEVYDLTNIQTKLLVLLKNQLNISSDTYNETQNLDTSFLIYKLDLFPYRDMLRRNDPKILEKYLFKLKHDIYEVMRDIAGIQKVSKSKLTKNIKLLARAMQRYVHQEGGKHKKNKESKIQRRRGGSAQSMKEYILIILETIYNEAAEGNKIISLSQNAKRIMRRLVKEYYEEIDVIGLRLIESNTNLTKYLAGVGSEWRNTFYDIMNSSPKDLIYNWKLLHLQLQNDIVKMRNALDLIQFSQNRRILIVEDVKTEISVVSRLNNLLKFMDNNFAHMLNKTEKPNPGVIQATESTSPKYSFLSHVKNLLKNSKTDILKLLHKNVPKTKIIKEAAKNHIEELNERKLHEYESTFQIPNINFNRNIRSRRALFGYDKHQPVMNRLKNIVPKYLRGKLFQASTVRSVKVV